MISPTKQEVRSDPAGDGHFNAPRGKRVHEGVDFVCTPGQDLYMPIDKGRLLRKRYPYADDIRWQGIHIIGQDKGADIELVLFYCVCEPSTTEFKIGQRIGWCQDITERYSGQFMVPHIHLQVERVNPLRFFTEGKPYDWSLWDPRQLPAKG